VIPQKELESEEKQMRRIKEREEKSSNCFVTKFGIHEIDLAQ